MITLPSNYSTALQSQFTENWIVRLYKDSTNYIGLGFATITMSDTVSYTGAILNAPSIRESINLTAGTSQSGNLQLEIADHSTGSNVLSKELFVNYYINKDVKVYSVLNGSTTMSDALQIFNGRLTSYSVREDGKISLQITAKRPWDGIDLPNELSDTGVYVPVAYGDYTGHTTADFMTSKALYPSPRTSTANGNLYFLAPKSESTPVINTYDSRAEMFPNLDLDTNATVTKDSKNAFEVAGRLLTTYKFRPQAVVSGSGFTNPEYAIDGNSSNYATQSHTVTSGGSQTTDLKLELPSISGKFTSATLYLSGSITISSFVDAGTITLYDYSFGSLNTITQRSTSNESANTGTTQLASSVNILSSVVGNSNRLPDSIVLRLVSSSLDDIATNASINGVYLYLAHTVDSDNEPTASSDIESKLDIVYCGNDGFDKSWSSGTATKAHEVHRDILYRFLGVTDAPINYSSLDSEKNCTVRFFTEPNKTKPMKELLNRLSYEGGFNFRFRNDGSPIYHFIPNSPSAVTFSDNSTSLTHSDIKGLTISHTSLSDLITKWNVQYERNPAKNIYYSTATKTASGRTNYFDANSKENIRDEKLNHVVDNVTATDTNRNDSFLDYYNDIVGSVKQMIDFKMINPKKSNIEVGDVLSFTSMELNPLSGSWSSKYLVTSTNRSVGGFLDITAREI